MAYYPATPRLGLLKAEPGTNQAFETAVFNSNYDNIEAEAVAVDARLDVIEANNWVTSARIADGAVGSSELAANSVLASKVSSAEQANLVVCGLRSGGVVGGQVVTVFVQEAEPTARAVGDLWFW